MVMWDYGYVIFLYGFFTLKISIFYDLIIDLNFIYLISIYLSMVHIIF